MQVETQSLFLPFKLKKVSQINNQWINESLMIITMIYINSAYYQEQSQNTWETDLQTISA